MTMWTVIEDIAWVLSALIVAGMVIDLLRVNRRYSEEFLTSSREGELEAIEEEAHHHAH